MTEFDVPGRRTGKRPPLPGRAAIPFSVGLTGVVPDHPLVDLDASEFSYPMDGNDRWGVCVVVTWDHLRYVVTRQLTGEGQRLTMDEIIALYRTQNPNFDPLNYREQDDQGMYVQMLLEHLVKTGRILGFAKIDHTNLDELKAATHLGLALATGSALTRAQSWQDTWDYVPGDQPWGGHAVAVFDYRETRAVCASWAELHDMTDAFLDRQMDEAWFVIMREHVEHPGFRAGYDLYRFAQAYETLTGRSFPIIVPPPTPPKPEPVDPTESLTDLLARWWRWVIRLFTR